jgi:hypothetical protein
VSSVARAFVQTKDSTMAKAAADGTGCSSDDEDAVSFIAGLLADPELQQDFDAELQRILSSESSVAASSSSAALPIMCSAALPIMCSSALPIASSSALPNMDLSAQPSDDLQGATGGCWGAPLKALHFLVQPPCDADFVPDKKHMKNKFCARCSQGILVPSSHVRALTTELAHTFANSSTRSVWSRLRHGEVSVDFRVANQTQKCRGSAVAIFRTQPPDLEWAQMPPHWLSRSTTGELDTVCFVVANGTMVPSGAIAPGYQAQNPSKRLAAAAMLEPAKRAMPSALGRSTSPALSIVPATLLQPSMAIPTQPSLLASFLPSNPISPPLAGSSLSAGTSATPSARAARAGVPSNNGSSSSSSSSHAGGGTADEPEAGCLLPSPPMSPPDAFTSSTACAESSPVAVHPWTRRFLSCTATESEWRWSHARSVLDFAHLLVPIGPVFGLASGIADTNEGSRIWLLSWGLGWLPASLILLALHARYCDVSTSASMGAPIPLPRWVPHLLDAGACSLCILPQLILVAWTWGGVTDPVDARDVSKGAETFDRCFAQHFFAHLYLQINSTDRRLSTATLLISAVLLAFQAPISTTPAAEFSLCRKGILTGLSGGYMLDRILRHTFLKRRLAHEKPPLPASSAAAGPLARPSTAFVQTDAGILTPRFLPPALEQEYRDWLLVCSDSYLRCYATISLVRNLCNYVEGDSGLRALLLILLSESVPHCVCIAAHRHGDLRNDTRSFRVFFLVYDITLLTVKLFMPTLARGGGYADVSEEGWLFMQPLFLTFLGPSTYLRYLLSATALAMCYNMNGWTSRANQEADVASLRATIVSAELFAILVDRGMRAHFRRTRLDPRLGDACVSRHAAMDT